MALFFYGTLRDIPLLQLVLGHDAGAVTLVDAVLPDHAVYQAAGQDFPLIVEEAGAQAHGLWVEGLTKADQARLDYYEGGFGYALRDVTVQTAGGPRAAQVWFPVPGLWQAGDLWSLENWQAAWGAISRRAAEEVMGYYGQRPAAEVARMFPMIRARASTWVAARAAVPLAAPSGMGLRDVAMHDMTRAYADFFAVEEHHLSFRRFDGSMSGEVKRAVFIATDASLVLPYDPVRDVVLVVEQFRVGPFARGDASPWALEPVAGRVDPGETPEAAARREAREEAGLDLRRLERVGGAYPSPGSTSEFYHMFIGLCDLPDAASGIGGLASEAEDIRSHILSFAAFLEMVDQGQLNVLPLQLMALWLARHRARLRAA